MRIISWNINGAKRFLRECRYDELMAMWLWVDIFAYQETKETEPEFRLRFPGYYEYGSFCETEHTASPQSGTVCFL